MTTLFTVRGKYSSEFRLKGSRFYSRVYPASTLDIYKSLHHQLKEEFPDATHICPAYRILIDDRLDEFSSDDGEPSGTAGRPILNALKKADVINVCAFVVRYYGGTKLGVPGLIEAYGTTAQLAAESVQKVAWKARVIVQFTYAYDQQRLVDSVLNSVSAKIVNQDFSDQVITEISLLKEDARGFMDLLVDKSAGSLSPKIID